MGAYLSEPITKKVSTDSVGRDLAYGASSMQGWRISQEDAHNCCLEFDQDVSLFAVYDGHGGHEVATYCARNLPDFIKQTEAYKRGDISQALIDAFLGFDATLAKPEVVSILKELAGASGSEKKEDQDQNDSDDEENVNHLCMEAAMPLEEVMAKYHSETGPQARHRRCATSGTSSSNSNQGHSSNSNQGHAHSNQGHANSNEGSGCSSNQGHSSNSSQGHSASSNSSQGHSSDQVQSEGLSSNQVQREGQSSNQAQSQGQSSNQAQSQGQSENQVQSEGQSENQVQSQGQRENQTRTRSQRSSSPSAAGCSSSWSTSEGDVSSSSQPCVGPLSSSAEPKSRQQDTTDGLLDSSSKDMPDSSQDVRATSRSSPEKNGASVLDADSSLKTDNVSSSSSGPVENGERISSSGRRRIQPVTFYQNLLKKPSGDQEEDEDDDDENDKTFDGVPESDEDEDTEDVDEDEESDEDDDDDEDEDPDGDEDDDDEEDDDDDDDDSEDLMMNMEEPGSDSGCTAVVAILKGRELYVANAGDSRCVLCRDGQAVELSLDHKPEDEPEMERIVKAGGKVTADGRVNGGLNLSRALGDHAYKQNLVLPPQEQMISAQPDVRHVTVDPERDEFLVLACDGIWNFMSSQDVVQFVRARLTSSYENLSKICEELFDHCLAPDTYGDGTGCDNMTAVIVRFKSSTATATETSPLGDAGDVCARKRTEARLAPEVAASCKRQKTEAATT